VSVTVSLCRVKMEVLVHMQIIIIHAHAYLDTRDIIVKPKLIIVPPVPVFMEPAIMELGHTHAHVS
jgi:hypothetical protein